MKRIQVSNQKAAPSFHIYSYIVWYIDNNGEERGVIYFVKEIYGCCSQFSEHKFT